MTNQSGMTFAPQGKPAPVLSPGESFPFAVAALDHGHIFGMCNGLLEAGATLTKVYDPDPAKVLQFQKAFPQAVAVDSVDEILQDPSILLVAAAAITCDRAPLGIRCMDAGKDYFTDKAPLVSLEQLADVKTAIQRTGRKFMCYYSERLHVEVATVASELIAQGAIGRVLQTIGTGPHRLSAASRPDWFFNHAQYGGILCDIGSHQIEQFLHYTGNTSAHIVASQVANYANPEYPELEDFGDCMITGENGATGYFRVDWFTPDGLSAWGDGRTIILGTEGFIEMRKYTNLATENTGSHLFLVTKTQEQHIHCEGTSGFPFFGRLVRDCLDRTETAMTQDHCLLAAELCVRAQLQAKHLS